MLSLRKNRLTSGQLGFWGPPIEVLPRKVGLHIRCRLQEKPSKLPTITERIMKSWIVGKGSMYQNLYDQVDAPDQLYSEPPRHAITEETLLLLRVESIRHFSPASNLYSMALGLDTEFFWPPGFLRDKIGKKSHKYNSIHRLSRRWQANQTINQ